MINIVLVVRTKKQHTLEVQCVAVPRVGEYVEFADSGWHGYVDMVTHGYGKNAEIRVYLDGTKAPL